MKYFGDHLVVDLYNIKEEKLVDVKGIEELFKNIIQGAGMSALGDFISYEVDNVDLVNSDRESGGVTAIQVIKESHISIHTFKGVSYIGFDIFTCKKLDIDIVLTKLQEFFSIGASDIDYKNIKRGTRLHFT